MRIDTDCIGSKLGATDAKNGQAWEYQGGDNDQFSFRTWKPDSSFTPNKGALLVSSKIDFNHGGIDDHTLIMLTFNQDCTLIEAEADMQLNLVEKTHEITKKEKKTIKSGIVTGSQEQITNEIYNSLTAGLFELDGKKYVMSGDASPAEFPNVVKANIDIFASCITDD
jgi:hypothetical protein